MDVDEEETVEEKQQRKNELMQNVIQKVKFKFPQKVEFTSKYEKIKRKIPKLKLNSYDEEKEELKSIQKWPMNHEIWNEELEELDTPKEHEEC